jgi:beta-mannosidase
MLLPLASSPRVRWTVRDTTRRRALPATVPGCVHTDLRAAKLIPDPFYGTHELDLQWIEDRDWEYRGVFTVSAALLAEEVVDLCADGLDTVATVYLNGRKIAATDNMFTAHRWDVKRHLRRGRNELRVVFCSALDYIRRARPGFTPPQEFNDPVGNCVRIRKQACQFGWDWGPRFVTAGIWRDLRLEGWTGNRLAALRLAQTHHADGTVTVTATPALARPDPTVAYKMTLSLDDRVVAAATGSSDVLAAKINLPALWWPAGQGEQPLYDVTVTARDAAGRELGTLNRRLGLRTIVLDRSPDAWGEAFRFVVNGRPIFFKGANWIPAHSFVTTLDRAAYARDLRAAVAAHMNGVRVWGGGIYESEDFYDLCDELGLMVWQDFMFACTLYPADEAFLASIRAEADHQVARLHHRACLALWCGNNELVQINGAALRTDPALRAGYERLFHELLPAAVAAHDGITPYWPTSEWRGTFENGHALGEVRGDTHFWDVWHARHPVKDYEKWAFRFVSEFGMQSYSSPQTNATFCPPGETNVFGPVMENHQKNRAGNQIILDYVSRHYRYPKTQDDLIWLSQLNQAHCMQVGVEHYRRLMPRCMGAIYWQLNDCWPVASWSSLEHTGRWKALHYAARRFFAPALVTAHVPGDESATIGNYRRSDVRYVHLYTVYDAPRPARGRLRWDLMHVDGRRLDGDARAVRLRPGTSVKQRTLDLAAPLARFGRDHLYVRLALDVEDSLASQQTILLAPPRFVALPRARATVALQRLTPTEFELTAKSPAYLHAFTFEFGDALFTATDNGFDLHPGEPQTARVSFDRPLTLRAARQALTHRSLVDAGA